MSFHRVMQMPPTTSTDASDRITPCSVGYEQSMQETLGACDTQLSLAFFSDVNAGYLQTRIQQEFHQLTGIVVEKQRKKDLLMIMRYVFVARSKNLEGQEAQQLAELNHHVVDTVLPQIATSVEQHLGYLRDASTLPVPLERSVATTIRGENTIYSNQIGL